jgi:hypothetical protein
VEVQRKRRKEQPPRHPIAHAGARRGRVAWCLSALAHALAAALLLALSRGRRPAPDQVRGPAPLEFEIAERALGTPTPRQGSPAARPAPAPVERPRPDKDGRLAARPVTDGTSGPEDTSERDRSAPPDATASAPGPAARAGSDRAPPDLSLGALSLDARRRLAGPAPEAELRATPHLRPSVDELRVEVERQEDAVANVEKGRVDPILFDYLRGARTRFEADARRLAEAIPMGARATMRSWERGYLQRVDEVNRGRGAGRGPGQQSGLPPRGRGDTPFSDVLGAYDETAGEADAGAEERIAEVCLDVGPGKVAAPSLRRRSGNLALDHLAVDSFARAIAARPVPADTRAGLACFEVRIKAFRMPPVPVLSCGFDEHDNFGCVWPFKKITAVTGRLLSVDYAHHESATASRSLLRRAR